MVLGHCDVHYVLLSDVQIEIRLDRAKRKKNMESDVGRSVAGKAALGSQKAWAGSDRVIALMKKLLQAKEIKTRRNVRFGHGNEIQTKRAVVRAFPSSVFCGGLPRGVSKRGKDSKTTRKKISGGRRDGEGPGG